MKVFGKKSLSLLLAIVMALSVCSVSAFAGNEENTVELTLGKTATKELTTNLKATENVTKIAWSSDAETVATVENGKVTAKGVGTATITAEIEKIAEGEITEGNSAIGAKETWTITVKKLIKSISPATKTLKAGWGATDEAIKTYLNGLKFDVTYTDDSADKISFEWKKTGDTWTANVVDKDQGVTAPTATVEVLTEATIESFAKIENKPIAINSEKYDVEKMLEKEIPTVIANVKQENVDIEGKKTVELSVRDWELSDKNFAADEKGAESTFAAVLSNKMPAGLTNPNDKKATVKTVVSNEWTQDIELRMSISDGEMDIESHIEDYLSKKYEDEFRNHDIIISPESGKYGKITSRGDYELIEKKLEDKDMTEDAFSYKVEGDSGVKYSGKIVIKIYNDVFNYETKGDAKNGGVSLSEFAAKLNARLEDMYGRELESLTFTDIQGGGRHHDEFGGVLYLDNTCAEEPDIGGKRPESYDYDALKEMFFRLNGSGNTTEIEYEAETSKGDSVKGTITINSDKFLLIFTEEPITNKDVLEFSSDVFVEAMENSNKDWDLEYVKFKKPSSGDLYFNYDGEDGKKVSTSSEAFVNPEHNKYGIDDVTYVPSKSTDGKVSVEFVAYGPKTSQHIDGIVLIDVKDVADIVITAGINESVALDLKLFENFADDADHRYFDEIAYIVFEGAPHSTRQGYLCEDGDELKDPDGVKFYVNYDKHGKYDVDFNDASYLGGKYESEKRAEFTVYYYKTTGSSSSMRHVTGTVDFVTGKSASATFNGIKASERMIMNPNAFLLQGYGTKDHPNQYVVFTKYPAGGKLWYNYGTASQKPVQLNTPYYLTNLPYQTNLSGVTFVPAYIANKGSTVNIEIETRVYVNNSKSAPFTVKFPVYSQTTTRNFTDVTSAYSWAVDSIDFLYNTNITKGVGGPNFAPARGLSRAEFVTFMYRAAGSPNVSGLKNPFSDVKSGTFYYNAVLWANQNNITSGVGNGKFAPDRGVTRQELLVFLQRYDVNYMKNVTRTGSLHNFVDNGQVASWAVAGTQWAVGKGVLTGTSIQPTVTADRATMALWLHRMLTL